MEREREKGERATDSKLNERQKKFAEYYAQSGNAYQSALEAGYSENYAKSQSGKLSNEPKVADYVRSLQDTARKKRILTALQRQEMLSDIARNTETEPADRIRAIDTLNKMTGEYTQRISLDGERGVVIIDDVKRTSD